MASAYSHATEVSISTVLTGFLVIWLLSIVLEIVYNLYFHPLRKFPGPWYRAGLLWPSLWESITGDQVFNETYLHDKYGPVVRVAPNTLSFNGGTAWKDIYGIKVGQKQLQKDPSFYLAQPKHLTKDIIAADDIGHARMRKLLAHAFSEAATKEQESLINEHIDLFIKQLRKRDVADIMTWLNFLTFDIIGDLAFGESFHALETGEEHEFVRSIFQGVKFTRFVRAARYYPLLKRLLSALPAILPYVGRSRQRVMDFAAEKVRTRLRQDVERKDFTTYITRYNDERGMTEAEIEINANLLVIAGSETTATTLSGIMYLLATNQDACMKLSGEVRDRFQDEADITFASTATLPFLNAVIQEGLRMYPPVPARLPRVTSPSGNVIDGHVVPPKTSVGVLQYAAHYSSQNWQQPKKFLPERWLKDADFQDDHAVFQPFSTGPRNCIGRNLAYIEMRMILARLIWNFDFKLERQSRHWMEQKIFLLWDKPPLWLRLDQVQRK